MLARRFMWVPVCVGLTALYACESSQSREDWEKAKIAGTPGAYSAFLQTHPDSFHSDVARKQLEQLAWEQAQRHHDEKTYTEFINTYPKSNYLSIARRRLEDVVWEQAQAVDSEQMYKKYLQRFPQTARANLVAKKLLLMRWRQAQQRDEPQSYRDFLNEYPDSEYSALAVARLDDLSWSHAVAENTPDAYDAYFKWNKIPRHFAEALARLHCVDPQLRKDFPSWLRFEKIPQTTGYETNVNTDFDGLKLLVDPLPGNSLRILVPTKPQATYVSGKGVIVGWDGTKVLVGYDCR